MDAANRVCEFFERFLQLSKGVWAYQPFRLLEWQRTELLQPLFGWKRPDGARRYRIGYVEIPKKNGKSALCSGLALYLASADGEPGAEVYNAAADRLQAEIVFNESRNMIRSSPQLSKYAIITDSKKRIDFPATNSFIRVISSEAYTAEGLNIHGLIFDELHAQKTRELWDALRYGGAARRQPLLLSITTAGWDTASICFEQHEYAKNILSGVIEDDAFFPLIYSAGKEDDITAPETWRKANPSLGETIQESDMSQAAQEAAASPAKASTFKRYRLNIWTENAVSWMSLNSWDDCAAEIDPEAWAGCECYAGLDLSKTTDLSALVLVFSDGEEYTILPYFWCPEDCAKDRDTRNRMNYMQWGREGYIELTPGNTIDYRFIRKRINEIAKKYRLIDIGYDPYNASHIAQELQEEDGIVMVEMRQGAATMNEPSKEFERRVLAKTIRHSGNPVMRWMVGNVTIRVDANENIVPDKKKSAEKIDGVVATIMGIGRAMHAENNVFDGRILIL